MTVSSGARVARVSATTVQPLQLRFCTCVATRTEFRHAFFAITHCSSIHHSRLCIQCRPRWRAGRPCLQPLQFSSLVSSHTYRRGFDTAQVQSNSLVSRNFTAHLTVISPPGTVTTQSYQFRIVTGFSKMPVSGNIVSYPGPSAVGG